MSHPPYLVAAANKLGVAIDAIQGTGASGAVTIGDVRAAARSTTTPQPRAAVSTGGRVAPVLRPLRDPWGNGGSNDATVMVDIYSLNPYVDYILQGPGAPRKPGPSAQPGFQWIGGGTPPTFFISGTLPPLTASGIDPAILARVPWLFRHTAALSSSAAEVLALLELGSDFDGIDNQLNSRAGIDALQDYRNRVWTWAIPKEVPIDFTDQELQTLFPGAAS